MFVELAYHCKAVVACYKKLELSRVRLYFNTGIYGSSPAGNCWEE